MTIPECSICLEEIYPIQLIEYTPCLHYYHFPCFDRWSNQRPPNTRNLVICPTCKYSICSGMGNEPFTPISNDDTYTGVKINTKCKIIITVTYITVLCIMGAILYLNITLR